MSATTAPAAAANALTGGLNVDKAAAVTAKPRTRTTTSRSGSEATEAPLLAATPTRPRRTREPAAAKALGEATDFAFSRDLNVIDEGGAITREESAHLETTKHKATSRGAEGRGTPVKHKTVKSALHQKGAVHKERKRSIWDVMGHLFSRLFLVFVVGAGLGTTAWSLRAKPPVQHREVSSSEIERLEEFVTKTTKWMQVQLEVLDMKIGKEASEIRDEMKQKLDSQVAHFNSELKDLKSQVDQLYQNGGPLNKNEAIELMKSVVDQRAAEGGSRSFSLEDVRSVARRIVLSEVEKHAADGIGRSDYALASGGGRVVEHSEGFFIGRSGDWSTMAFSILPGASRKHPLANKVLEPSFGEPGQCLPLKGSNAFVEISLRTAIYPDAVTLEHVSKSAGYDVKSAPKEFQVFGWRETRPSDRVALPSVHRLLGEFVYDTNAPSIQTFQLARAGVGDELINIVRLHVVSNHGNDLHTCIYRFRVHGIDPKMTQAVSR